MKVKVTSYKNKLRFTIPIDVIKNIDGKTNDYIKINLKKDNKQFSFYSKIPKKPRSRKILQLKRTIPKKILNSIKIEKGELIDINIIKINNSRSKSLLVEENIDMLSLIPLKTSNENMIMVDSYDKNGEEWLKIWYCSGHGGDAKLIRLKRYIRINKELGELFGLMQAESGKTGRKFTFTNKLISEIKLFIKISENLE